MALRRFTSEYQKNGPIASLGKILVPTDELCVLMDILDSHNAESSSHQGNIALRFKGGECDNIQDLDFLNNRELDYLLIERTEPIAAVLLSRDRAEVVADDDTLNSVVDWARPLQLRRLLRPRSQRWWSFFVPAIFMTLAGLGTAVTHTLHNLDLISLPLNQRERSAWDYVMVPCVIAYIPMIAYICFRHLRTPSYAIVHTRCRSEVRAYLQAEQRHRETIMLGIAGVRPQRS